MICKQCGANIPDDSDFCMNCGVRIIPSISVHKSKSLHNEMFQCYKCGKPNYKEARFCTECGCRLKRKNTPILIGFLLVICAFVVLTIIHINSLHSPIKGVSQRIYNQGQEYLDKMDTPTIKNAISNYINSNTGEQLNNVYNNIGVNFNIELGNHPTPEEIYYAKLINKFWESKAIYYSHEAIIAKYKDRDEIVIQMANNIYKGIISTYKDSIDDAEKELKKASSMSDMETVNQMLDEIWRSEAS